MRILAVLLVGVASVSVAAPSTGAAPVDREVTFVTSDKVKVAATQLGSGATGVVLGYMLGGDRGEWLSFGRRLAADGYMVVVLDFRGHGKTSMRPIANLEREMLAAAAFLKQQGARSVALGGASMGGTAAVKASASGGSADLIAISSPQTYGAYVTDADLRRITVPSLWIVGAGDTDFVRSMRIMAAGVRGQKRFQEFPGTWHGTQFFDSPYSQTFGNLMVEFLRRTVPAQ